MVSSKQSNMGKKSKRICNNTFDMNQYDQETEREFNEEMRLRPEDKFTQSIFTKEEQIERYAKTIAFFTRKEGGLDMSEPHFYNKKMFLSSKRMNVWSRVRYMFDEATQQQIWERCNELLSS